MFRTTIVRAAVAAALVLPLAPAPLGAAPVRLARHPDYHAGKIAFSYLGDIWTANEDGTERPAPHRQPRARGLSALLARRHAGSPSRRTATATTTCSSSPATGGTPKRLTYHTGNDDVVGWTRDSQQVIFRAARGDGAFPNVATLYQIAGRRAAMEQPLPRRLGLLGQLLARRQVARLQPPSRRLVAPALSRQLRGRPVDRRPRRRRPTRSCSADERYNRYWPMWGADDAIYFVADPLPNDKSVKPGSPEVRKSANNIYKIPAKGGQPVQVTQHTDGNLFWPSMSSDGKVIVYEDNFGIWKLDVAIGQDQRDQARHRHRREGERGRGRDGHQRGRRVRHLAVGPARGDLGARADPDDRDRSRRHHARRARQDGVAQRGAEVVGRRQVHRVRLRSIRPRRSLDQRSGGQEPEEDHRSRQREGRARLDAGLEGAALHGRRQEALQLHRRRRQDGGRRVERRRPHRLGRGLARQQVGRVLEAGPHAALARLHRADRAAARSGTSRTTACSTPRPTPSGPPTAATSSSRRPKAPATASRRRAASTTTMALWALSLRDQDRDPMNRDIDNEAQGLAAEAAARQNTGRGGGAGDAAAGRGAHRLERPRAPRAAAHRAGHGDRRPHAGAGGPLGRADGVDRRRRRRPRRRRRRRRRRACTSSTSRAAS